MHWDPRNEVSTRARIRLEGEPLPDLTLDIAELERLLAEAERAGGSLKSLRKTARQSKAQFALSVAAVNALPALLAELETLREALRRYGRHWSDCPARAWTHTDKEAPLCDCGFSAALEGAPDA